MRSVQALALTLAAVSVDSFTPSPLLHATTRRHALSSAGPLAALYEATLQKPMGIVFEDNDASEGGGLYVLELAGGGAAEASGLIAPGDQLVAIDGDAVFDATFDAAMARLAAVDAEARLEFFRGDRSELLAAVGRRAAAPGAATITVDDRGERREIVVEAGANLRDALVKDGIDVYRGTTAWTNCAGHQMCGTCIVDVVGGAAATNRKSNDEEGTLNLQGCEPSCRLSCVTFVYGDVEVRVRPDRDGGFFGSATSGSAW